MRTKMRPSKSKESRGDPCGGAHAEIPQDHGNDRQAATGAGQQELLGSPAPELDGWSRACSSPPTGRRRRRFPLAVMSKASARRT